MEMLRRSAIRVQLILAVACMLMLIPMQLLMSVPVLMLAATAMLMLFVFHSQVAMLVLAPVPMFMMAPLLDWSVVRVRASVVAAGVFVAVEDAHDVEVAEEAEDRGAQHGQRLLDDCCVEDAVSGLEEELESDDPDDGDVDERSQRLHLLVAEGECPRALLVALVDGVERDDIGGDIGEQVEGIRENGDGVRVVAAEELDGHEDEGDHRDLPQFRDYDAVLTLHNNYNSHTNPAQHRGEKSTEIQLQIFQSLEQSIGINRITPEEKLNGKVENFLRSWMDLGQMRFLMHLQSLFLFW